MKSFKRPNAPHNEPWEVWRPAQGYALVRHHQLSVPFLVRRKPKDVKGKAAVKRAKRARHHAHRRPERQKEDAA